MQATLGQRLKQAREYRHLTLEKAGEATRIRVSYLQALEADDYSGMVSDAQARGFLRNYSEYLGLNIAALLKEVEHEAGQAGINRAQVDQQDSQPVSGPLAQVDIPSERNRTQNLEPEPARPRLPWIKRAPLLSSAGNKKDDHAQNARVGDRPSAGEPFAAPQKEVQPGRKHSLRTTRIEAVEKPARKSKRSAEKQESLAASPPIEPEQLLQDSEKVQRVGKGTTGSKPQPAAEREESLETQENRPTRSAQTAKAKPGTGFLDRMKSIFMIRFGARGRSQVSEADEEFQSPESAPPRERPPLPSQNPEQIFTAIGKQLRDRRELLSLTLEEVERHTHIRSLYLKALENGSLDLLPSPVQTRGLLSGYATFLDLDTDRLMLQFADVIQARHRQKYPGTLRARGTLQASSGVPPLRAFIASDVLFGLGTLIAVAGLAIWGISRLLNPPQIEQTIQSTAPSISEVLAGTAVASFPQEVTLIPAADTPVPEIEATAAGELAEAGAAELINVQVNIVAVARTFMRVNVDGEEQFNGQVLPGTIYPFEAGNQIEVLTGNGAALRITFNGRELGLMGSLGEVVSRIYTSEGIATATATLPPTATATSPVTATPTFTVTSTPTRAP